MKVTELIRRKLKAIDFPDVTELLPDRRDLILEVARGRALAARRETELRKITRQPPRFPESEFAEPRIWFAGQSIAREADTVARAFRCSDFRSNIYTPTSVLRPPRSRPSPEIRRSTLARRGSACSRDKRRLSSTSKSRTATSYSSRRFSCALGGTIHCGCCRPARSSFAATNRRSRLMATSRAGSGDRTSGFSFAGFMFVGFEFAGLGSGRGDQEPGQSRCLCRRLREIRSRTPYPAPKPMPTIAARMRKSNISSSRIALPSCSYFNNCGEELAAAGSIPGCVPWGNLSHVLQS